MAKILIATYLEDYDAMKTAFAEAGFQESYSSALGSGGVTTYRKKHIMTHNFYQNGEDFALGVGTFIFNDKIDQEALKDVLTFFSGDVGKLQKYLAGSYCICVRKNGLTYVFVDSNHTYNIYYFLEDDRIIITNTYYHIARQVDIVTVSEINAIEIIFQFSNLSNDTPFNEVKKLCGTEYLFFDGSVTNKWAICTIDAEHTLSDDWSQDRELLYESFGTLFESSGIFLTGGQDSRLVLGMMLSIGMKPTLFYGVGDSVTTNTKQEDQIIVEEIASLLDLNLKIMNWRDVDGREYRTDDLEKYGEMYTLYNHNRNVINEFETDIGVSFLEFGYFGEIFRNIEWLENYHRNGFSVEDLVDDFYIDKKLAFVLRNYSEYRNHILHKLNSICLEKQLDPNNIDRDDFQRIHLEYRKSADTVMCNFSNLFFYSTPLLSAERITNYVESLTYQAKKDSQFQLDLMRELREELLDIPFFSHLKTKVYDQQTNTLKDLQPKVMRYKEILRKTVKNQKLLFLLRRIYYTVKNDKKGYSELLDEVALKSEIRGFMDPTFSSVDTTNLMEFYGTAQINRFRCYAHMIDQATSERREIKENHKQ